MISHGSTPQDTAVTRALFDGLVQGVIFALYENERPPRGLAGLMDWYFQGVISQTLRKQILLGKKGECTYYPIHRNGTTYHLLLLGAGWSPEPGVRQPLPEEVLYPAKRNLTNLKIGKVGISAFDFGIEAKKIEGHFKEMDLWIAH